MQPPLLFGAEGELLILIGEKELLGYVQKTPNIAVIPYIFRPYIQPNRIKSVVLTFDKTLRTVV